MSGLAEWAERYFSTPEMKEKIKRAKQKMDEQAYLDFLEKDMSDGPNTQGPDHSDSPTDEID